MKIKTLIEYDEGYLPTPRHRKLRYNRIEEFVYDNLAETTMENLKLAFEDNSYDGEGKIYLFRKKLWRKARVRDICCDDEGKFKTPLEAFIYWRAISSEFFPREWRDGEHPDKKKMLKAVRNETKTFLLVDGELYTQTTEPRYVVMTFGLGHNHGGTALMVTHHYNPNIRKTAYFNALQGDEAIAYANEKANTRGDTNDVGTFEKQIVVHLPELVKVKPNKQHGNGNKLLNTMEEIIESSDSPAEAGLLVSLMALSQ